MTSGDVCVPAIDIDGNVYSEHPTSKEMLIGFKVPEFDKAVKMVKEAAVLIPQVGYVGWDVAISTNGPSLVEGNCFPGIFQAKPSLLEKKEGLIPKYNKVMELF